MANETIDLYGGGFSDEFIREWNRKRYCRRCGQMLRYDALGRYVCMGCGKSELDDYGKVREYLDENGPSPAKVIEADTGVPSVVIHGLLEQGKIEIPEKSDRFISCQICGTPIRFGKICSMCAARQADGLAAVAAGFVGDSPAEKKAKQDVKECKAKVKPRMHTWAKRR